jgi:hypothetical protein
MLKFAQVVLLKDLNGTIMTLHIRQTECLQDLAINLLTCFFKAYNSLRLYLGYGIYIQGIALYFIRRIKQCLRMSSER